MRHLLHISDVHFGPPHRPELAEKVLEFADRRKPDAVVLSGDLTQRAKPEQFRQARRFVDRFPAPALVVPGNHDVPLYRFW
jgi:3',5'-cyclic AMP phosphodiesterase CpdA